MDKDATAAVLKYADFSHYADYFNGMEDENIAQAIPNAKASEWIDVYKRQIENRTPSCLTVDEQNGTYYYCTPEE